MGNPTWALVLELDNMIINNYWRKYKTYLELGWDDASIKEYLSKKEFIMQIASFNTPTVSFSASSRRNRFYEVYNHLDMLDQDVAWPDSINALNKIKEKYQIYVISSRTDDLKEKTLHILTTLGFPMNNLTIFFKKSNENLHSYKQACMAEIVKHYPTGVGVCLQPRDIMLFQRYNYTPIAFTSLKNPEDFNGDINVICHDWNQIKTSLQCE